MGLGGLLALALVAFTVLSVLGNFAVTRDQVTDEMNAQALQVKNDTGGHIQVVGGDVDQVQLERTLSTGPLGRVDETVDEDGDGLQVQARCPGPGFLSTCEADYRITVPEQSDLDLQTTSGAITVQDHQGSVEAETTSGELELTGVQGSVQAQSTSGQIVAEGEGEQIQASTTSGKVDLSGFSAQDLQASTISGNVQAGDFAEADISTTSGSVQAHSRTELQSLTVDTTSGSVSARLPDTAYDVTVQSTSGSQDIGVDTSSDSQARIRIDTTSGSVELEKL